MVRGDAEMGGNKGVSEHTSNDVYMVEMTSSRSNAATTLDESACAASSSSRL